MLFLWHSLLSLLTAGVLQLNPILFVCLGRERETERERANEVIYTAGINYTKSYANDILSWGNDNIN